VDKSVLTRTGGGSSRYRMLDTVREFGGERLAASGIQPRVRARHLRRYLAMAEELTARPLERQLPKYQALRAEHADIRAALEYAATAAGDADLGRPAVQLPTRLEWYWVLSGRFQEARYWLTRALELVPEPGPDRARVLTTRGYVTAYQGDLGPAFADANEAVALADDLGDRHLKARALVYLAYVLITENRLEESKKTAIEAEQLFDREDELAGLPIVLAVVKSYVDLLTGDVEGCLRHCERSLRAIPADGDERWGSGYLLGLVGLALSLLGQPDEGNKAALRGLAMKHELRDVVGMAHCLGVASLASSAQHRHERTAWLIGATGPLWEQLAGAYMGVNEMRMFAEQAAEQARAALGDDWYAEVVRDALSRSIDEVVDVAVRDIDRIPALPPRP
jgi:non-specific serine/threonine protein kinase